MSDRKIRVLMSKPGIDGHWRGGIVVSRALRDAGMELIFGGFQNVNQIVEAAIQEGLILPADDTWQYIRYLNPEELKDFAAQVYYDFVHNHIREAADGLSSEDQRAEFHLKIGRHLLHCDVHKEAGEEDLTDIVNHLNGVDQTTPNSFHPVPWLPSVHTDPYAVNRALVAKGGKPF